MKPKDRVNPLGLQSPGWIKFMKKAQEIAVDRVGRLSPTPFEVGDAQEVLARTLGAGVLKTLHFHSQKIPAARAFIAVHLERRVQRNLRRMMAKKGGRL